MVPNFDGAEEGRAVRDILEKEEFLLVLDSFDKMIPRKEFKRIEDGIDIKKQKT
jgi:hypothetical protein